MRCIYTDFVPRFYCIISLRIAQLISFLSPFCNGLAYCQYHKHRCMFKRCNRRNNAIKFSNKYFFIGFVWLRFGGRKEKGNRCQPPDAIEIELWKLDFDFFFCFVQWDMPVLPPLLCSLDISSLSSCSGLKNILAMSMCVERVVSGSM